MTIELGDDAIIIRGTCGVEEVEDLLSLITRHRALPVDIRSSEWIHTAIWQVLMVTKVTLKAREDSSFTMAHVLPNVRSGHI